MEEISEIRAPGRSIPWQCGLALISWVSMVGFDFFLHGGLLARLYTRQSSFLLPAEPAFKRIPLGYLSFLLLAVVLVWIMSRLNIAGCRNGFVFSIKFGALLWGSFALGIYSISTAEFDLLAAWFAGQTIELGIAGIVIGAGISGKRLRALLLWVALFVVLMIIVTVILQLAGFSPPMKT